MNMFLIEVIFLTTFTLLEINLLELIIIRTTSV